MRQSKTETIISAMRILADDIQSEDGVANAAIREAADRLDDLQSRAKTPCPWTRAADHGDVYQGACGVTWEFPVGSPKDNGAKFCPRCGGRITLRRDAPGTGAHE
jgi:hypothetical protein